VKKLDEKELIESDQSLICRDWQW